MRNVIEEKLDTLVPISHQPRELIQQIIADIAIKYPEFATSIRKRIRTYLKSYRRSKRVKDMQAAAALAHQYQPVTNGLTKVVSVDYITHILTLSPYIMVQVVSSGHACTYMLYRTGTTLVVVSLSLKPSSDRALLLLCLTFILP